MVTCDLAYPWCPVAYTFGCISVCFTCITLYQIIQNIIVYSRWLSLRLTILYIQFFQTLCMSIHYFILIEEFNFLFLLMEYLQILFNTAVFYYFVAEASIVNYNLNLKRRLGTPLVIFNIIVSTGLALYIIVGNLKEGNNLYACDNPIWCYLQLSGLVLNIAFIFTGYILSKKLKSLRNIDEYVIDSSRELDLW